MINLIVNGNSYSYPQPGDKANTGWGSQATNWVSAVTAALTALGLGGTLTPTPNAVVDISSTTKGILVPRLTTTQRNAITSPATSLLIFNTTLGVFQYYTGSAWITIGAKIPDNVQFDGTLIVGGNISTSGSVTATGAVSGASLNSTGNANVTGNTTIAGTLGVTGDVAINTNKFNVTASSGNTAIAGTLGVTGDVSVNSIILNSNGRVILNQSGSIIQVLQNSSAGNSSTTSTSFVDVTNFTVTITPSSTSSRILVIASGQLTNSLVVNTNVIYNQRLIRDAVQLQLNNIAAESSAGGLQAKGNLSISYIDSPATTSPVTYKIQHNTSSASSTGSCNSGRIIAMEISG